MGAFDGYWIPGHGVIPRSYYRDKVEKDEEEEVTGYYVSWDVYRRDDILGCLLEVGSTGKWHDTLEEAEATLREHAHLNSVRWYKVEEDE